MITLFQNHHQIGVLLGNVSRVFDLFFPHFSTAKRPLRFLFKADWPFKKVIKKGTENFRIF